MFSTCQPCRLIRTGAIIPMCRSPMTSPAGSTLVSQPQAAIRAGAGRGVPGRLYHRAPCHADPARARADSDHPRARNLRGCIAALVGTGRRAIRTRPNPAYALPDPSRASTDSGGCYPARLPVTLLSGLPFGVQCGRLGVPCRNRRGEPRAVVGMAALVVGWPVAQSVITDQGLAGPAGPGERAAVAPRCLGVRTPGRIGVGRLGDRLASQVCFSAGSEVQGGAYLMPGVPGLACVTDVPPGAVAGT